MHPLLRSKKGHNFKLYGINMQLLSVDLKNKNYKFVDWFRKEGVRIVTQDFFGKKIEEIYIKYNPLFPINGIGSYLSEKDDDKAFFKTNYGITPLLSFSTPHIRINEGYFGVGHIKIHSDSEKFPYKSDSVIQNFRRDLRNDMKKYFGDRYAEHYGTSPSKMEEMLYEDGVLRRKLDHEIPICKGYMYLMFFYIISNDLQTMVISDAYLPISLDSHKHNDYKFSLFFPTGLTQNGNDIMITGGYGDFYSMKLIMKFADAIKTCRHDVANLDMERYTYNIIGTNDNKTYIDRRLENIMQQIGYQQVAQNTVIVRDIDYYVHKYIKYKTKYEICMDSSKNIKDVKDVKDVRDGNTSVRDETIDLNSTRIRGNTTDAMNDKKDHTITFFMHKYREYKNLYINNKKTKGCKL
jgi:hypothetical protein